MFARSLARPLAVFCVALALTACNGATNSPAGGGGATSAGDSVATEASVSAAAPGTDGFEGTLTSSGQYAATWSVAAGAEANPFNASANPSLTSDKGTFGNIKVMPDGTVSFGSAASELTNGSYGGSGAMVTLDSTGQFVCAFTVDTDLKGTNDGAILHMSGGMTVHWHSAGDLNCP